MDAVEQHPHRTPSAAPAGVQRDPGIDLIRALCVTGVIALHALMVGVTFGAEGPDFFNAAAGAAWIAPLTLLVPVMPLFFVIGGFSGLLGYRRMRSDGGTAAAFVAGRVRRLLLPAVAAVAGAGAGLAVLAVCGVPRALIEIAGAYYSQPLWFLAVFLGAQALLPALAAAHERAPLRAILGLAAGAVLVDVARGISGVDAIGSLNLAFVWLALQQLGFFLAEGRIDALTRRVRLWGVLGAVSLLAGGIISGLCSADLIANQTPPTSALLLVGIALTGGYSLLRDPIAACSARPHVARFSAFVTLRTMTIYLWHMPVLLTMAGVAALLASHGVVTLPEPSSTAWWLTRPLWLAIALLLIAGLARLLAGIEQRRLPSTTASRARASCAAAAGIAGVVLLLVVGTSVTSAVIATTVLLIALRLTRAAADRHDGAGHAADDGRRELVGRTSRRIDGREACQGRAHHIAMFLPWRHRTSPTHLEASPWLSSTARRSHSCSPTASRTRSSRAPGRR